jgi:predicted small lipoprotein YifL
MRVKDVIATLTPSVVGCGTGPLEFPTYVNVTLVQHTIHARRMSTLSHASGLKTERVVYIEGLILKEKLYSKFPMYVVLIVVQMWS